jgi:HK97 gp10 family phage protein
MEVKITDNSEEIKSEMAKAVDLALTAIGMKAEEYAKLLCPVDTGRLRNSITYDIEESDVYIGTNVEYAPYVELGTSKMTAKPFLKPAAEDHAETYKEIIKKFMNT